MPTITLSSATGKWIMASVILASAMAFIDGTALNVILPALQKDLKASATDEFEKRANVFFYDAAPNLNQFATKGSDFAKKVITKNPQLLVKLASADITKSEELLAGIKTTPCGSCKFFIV